MTKIIDKFDVFDRRIRSIEERFYETGYDVKSLVQSEVKKRWKIPPQSETQFGLFTALCIDTIDAYKQNRVRFFSPLFHENNIPVKSLPYAYPISAMGGFDDCGLNWVPPAGSTLGIIFENGSRSSPYYLGTLWHRNRGPDGEHNWNFNIEEYYKIHEGHRKGYLAGANDGSQVFPQWNTENYNGFDSTSRVDFTETPDAQEKLTYPNIYGFKTPQKHMVKLVDGDYKCGHKNKRLEIMSSAGNWMIFKDDPMHDCKSWSHPECGGGQQVDCEEQEESTTCEGESSNSSIVESQGNIYFKHKNECRPLKGPGTPQNNKCELPQSGIQFLSLSGHSFVMDDSVEEPGGGEPGWEQSLSPFSFGCSDKYAGKTSWTSATGHRIEMSDKESDSSLRGEENYIRMISASGNKIELNDHTTGKPDCPGSPPNVGGEKRGITMQSTSNHILQMIDEENEQSSPCRSEGGVPVSKATKAFIRLRSGYGLEILMQDDFSQEETQQQFIQLTAPQIDNTERGPHIFRMQEKPSGPGQIFVRAGGDYICSTHDEHVTVVGDVEKNPSNKITFVSNETYHVTEKRYVNYAQLHAFVADEIILLAAGKDCQPLGGAATKEECVPCMFPVACITPKGLVASDRVFASASQASSCVSIYQLLPFHKCQPWETCPRGELN